MSLADGTVPEPASTPPVPRILVVDDDLINQRILVNLLKRKGWLAAVARSGRECLNQLANDRYDLVLLDIQMPEMDGFQTAQRIRQSEIDQGNRQRTPIVALTALRQDTTRERCLAAGMDDHLAKPVNTVELYAVMHRLLGIPTP